MSKRKPRVLSHADLKTRTGLAQALPNPTPEILEGIGRVLSAHAFLEWRLSVLLYTLIDIDAAEQRVVTPYQPPLARAKIIRSLFEWNGVVVDMKDMITDLTAIGIIRDQLAHGVWIRRNGKFFLQSTVDYTDREIETDAGKEAVRYRHDFLPAAIDVSGTYFRDHRDTIISLIKKVEKLIDTAATVQSRRRAAIIASQISTTAKDADTRRGS